MQRRRAPTGRGFGANPKLTRSGEGNTGSSGHWAAAWEGGSVAGPESEDRSVDGHANHCALCSGPRATALRRDSVRHLQWRPSPYNTPQPKGITQMHVKKSVCSFALLSALLLGISARVRGWVCAASSCSRCCATRWPNPTCSECFLVLTIGMASSMDAFMFGEKEAVSLGGSVQRTRVVLLGCAALMTAVVVSSSVSCCRISPGCSLVPGTGGCCRSRRCWACWPAPSSRARASSTPCAKVGQVMLLDEPTNHLDISHQLDILTTLRETGVGVVVALHDLNLATTFCDEVLVLHKGRAVCLGRPADVLTEDLIREVYGVEVRILHPDGDETPLFQFLRPVTQT